MAGKRRLSPSLLLLLVWEAIMKPAQLGSDGRPSSMKPAQWTAILVLAMMVGGISFVTVYLGGSYRTPQEVPEEAPSLTFPIKAYPIKVEKADGQPVPMPPLVTE